MRILYGVYAMGHGHFSKAAVLAPLMEARGHEVRIVSSGAVEAPKGYDFRWHRHFPGLAYEMTEGRTDYKRSFVRWVKDMPKVARFGQAPLTPQLVRRMMKGIREPLSNVWALGFFLVSISLVTPLVAPNEPAMEENAATGTFSFLGGSPGVLMVCVPLRV